MELEDAIVKENDGQHLHWPSKYYKNSWTNPDKSLQSVNHITIVKSIEQTLMDVEAYAKAEVKGVSDFL